MKKILFFLTLGLFLFSCNNDDDSIAAELVLDRGLNDAPFLLPGDYVTAVRFTASDLSDFQGRQLESVEYYLRNTPNQCEVRVYTGSTGNGPETLVYSESVTVEMEANTWNSHSLSTPVDIGGEDIWLAIRLVLSAEDQTIGCDVGPAVTNGDWIVSDVNNLWATYRDFTNPTVSINWNIRGKLNE